MKLKNYAPAGHEILAELREYNDGTIITINPEHDKIMKVLKVGPMCTATNPLTNQPIKPGDYVMMDGMLLMQLNFTELSENTGKPIKALQGKEFNIAAFYLPDTDEKKYMPHIDPATDKFKPSRELNVIDNPGIEHSTYLKEERDNQRALNPLLS